jgi:hypothetical protein
MVLAVETSTKVASVAQDNAAIHVKDAEDRAALAGREAQEWVSRVEVENTTVLASARVDVEGLVRNIALLEGELVEVHRAREVAEEKFHGLFDMAADAGRRWEVFKKGHREHFEELTRLYTQGSELCLAIVCPPWVRNHLLEGIQITALRHTEMVGELAAL